MISQKDILIKQLRSKPCIGQGDEFGPDDESDTAKKGTNSTRKDVKAAIAALKDYIKTLNDATSVFGGTNLVAAKLNTILSDGTKKLVELTKETSFYEQRNVELAKKLGITTTAGTDLGVKLDTVGKTLRIGAESARTYAASIETQFTGLGKFISTQAELGNKTAKNLFSVNDLLQKQAGLSEESSAAFINYALQSELGIEQTVLQLASMRDALEANGVEAGTLNEMFDELSKVSAMNSTIFGKYPSQLGLAALSAKRLGTSFDAIAGAARGALNIEESIGAEMEYQLLTGQKINKGNENLLNTLRQQYLTGADPSAMAETYTSIFETQGDYIRNNVVAGEALAKTMGISTEEVYKQLRAFDTREALLQQLGNRDDIRMLIEGGKLDEAMSELKKAQDNGSTVAADQIESLEDFTKAQNTLLSSDEVLAKSMEDLRAEIAENTAALSNQGKTGLKNVQGRIEATQTTMPAALKPLITATTKFFNAIPPKLLEIAGDVILATDALRVLGNSMGANIPFLTQEKPHDDFILRPGQAPISFRKDDILIGGTDPFGQKQNANKMGGTDPFGQKQNANKMGGNVNIAAAIAQALESTNLYVTVKLDPLAVQTEAKFRATRLNRTA